MKNAAKSSQGQKFSGRLACIIHKSREKRPESSCLPRGTAGRDEATIAGLRERVHSGLPSLQKLPYFVIYYLWNSLKDNEMHKQ